MEQADALRKAQGLLNKAADESVSEHEREALQNKAFDLVENYGIDQALLNAKAEIKQKPTRRTFIIKGAQARYRMHALNSIAFACRCKPLNRNLAKGAYVVRNLREVEVFGFESDIDILEMLWTSLQLQGFKEVAKIKQDGTTIEYVMGKYSMEQKLTSTKAMRNSFWLGFGYNVADRIRAAQDRQNTEPGTDLVLYDRSKEVNDAVAEAFPNLGKADKIKLDSAIGFAKGEEAGERANIHDKTELKKEVRQLD